MKNSPSKTLSSSVPFVTTARAYRSALCEILGETLWPTRCAICDEMGDLICPRCRARLPFIDWWQACQHCGAPFGRIQCCECNKILLNSIGRLDLPYDACASATALSATTRTLVTTYKDRGERRLAKTMAQLMVPYVNPSWQPHALSYIPATARARSRRGFDHAELLAQECARALRIPHLRLFARPRSNDQRELGRKERADNMLNSIRVLPGASIPERVLVIDDVCTTGSTLFAATDALRNAGAQHIFCLTFTRA